MQGATGAPAAPLAAPTQPQTNTRTCSHARAPAPFPLPLPSPRSTPPLLPTKVITSIAHGTLINVAGMGATILGICTLVGTLVAKTLSNASINPFMAGAAGAGYNPVIALDVFLVQAAANTLVGHFLSLACNLWLLNVIGEGRGLKFQVCGEMGDGGAHGGGDVLVGEALGGGRACWGKGLGGGSPRRSVPAGGEVLVGFSFLMRHTRWCQVDACAGCRGAGGVSTRQGLAFRSHCEVGRATSAKALAEFIPAAGA